VNRQVYECDVAVVGGGLGGVAAALAAAEFGKRVLLSESTDWLGGQITSQGVSALDEHRYIESFGGTRSYYDLRESIRTAYTERFVFTGGDRPLNPGNGWVSALCFEPRVGLAAIERMLSPLIEAGCLTVLLEHAPVAASVDADRIGGITLRSSASGAEAEIRAAFVLDATELGDLLPLAGVEYVSGAEPQEETGEPHASLDGPHPDRVQGFTYCFAVEHCPGENHVIRKPKGYERFRDQQPYTFVLRGHHGEARPFEMFEVSSAGLPSFWTYRRLVDGSQFDPSGALRDVSMINWAGNDYHWASVIDKEPVEQARILEEAKRLALGFLYWLQTEAPHVGGRGRGYPGLRLLPEVMGTRDGLSKAPYIREARRILALKRIVEDEIVATGRSGARAEPFEDSVGVGWYAMDLHDCVGAPTSMYAPTLPFQIPLGALIPHRVTNLVAACKNIGTTHLTNGSYRLHPVEWNIGEAAGTLAAYCCDQSCTPRRVWESPRLRQGLQGRLLKRGVPLAWAVDVPDAHPCFLPAQMLLVSGALPASGPRFESLELQIDAALSASDLDSLVAALGRLNVPDTGRLTSSLDGETLTWRSVCARVGRCLGARPL
jgi:hypothetical protein